MKSTFLVSLFAIVSAAGASIVVPGINAGTEGSTSAPNLYLGTTGFNTVVYLPPELLTGLNIGDQITGLQFRLDTAALTGPSSTLNFSTYNVFLSEPIAGFSQFQPNNTAITSYGSNFVFLRGGPLSVNLNEYQGGGSPNPFGPIISFTNSYSYASTTGLMLLISQSGSSGPDLVVDAVGSQAGGQTYFAPYGQIFGNSAPFTIPVIQFQTAARASVPEPGTIGLISLGGLFLAVVRLQKHKSQLSQLIEGKSPHVKPPPKLLLLIVLMNIRDRRIEFAATFAFRTGDSHHD